jgi:hypothetical protein
MQMKRGNVTHMMFSSAEQAEIFLANMEAYYGKEKADRILSTVRMVAAGDSKEYLSERFPDVSETDSLESLVGSLL